jgi:hypothetical protein
LRRRHPCRRADGYRRTPLRRADFGVGESLFVVLAMRDELLAELIGWLDHANVDA